MEARPIYVPTDFGLTVVKRTETQVWCRGYGPDQYVYYAQQGPKEFLGGTFAVESYKELEKYAFRCVLQSMRIISAATPFPTYSDTAKSDFASA